MDMKDRNYMNKRCTNPECGWSTHSSMSRGYKYCPMCRIELEEYDMREKEASP